MFCKLTSIRKTQGSCKEIIASPRHSFATFPYQVSRTSNNYDIMLVPCIR